MKKIYLIILFYLLLNISAAAQFFDFNAGSYIGFGHFQGNSPSLASLGANIFVDAKTFLSEKVSFRLSFLHSRKLEYFLPENRKGKYYPYINAFNIKALIQQKLISNIYVEEGTGITAINDRTFSDTNVWDFGIVFSVLAGVDLRKNSKDGFRLGIGTEFATTFTNTTANYYTIHFQSQYYF